MAVVAPYKVAQIHALNCGNPFSVGGISSIGGRGEEGLRMPALDLVDRAPLGSTGEVDRGRVVRELRWGVKGGAHCREAP